MKLQGLRVVDLSLFLPGPLMTQFMADHGAEVIKIETLGEGVEQPEAQDLSRRRGRIGRRHERVAAKRIQP